jgi:hypothetical protein
VGSGQNRGDIDYNAGVKRPTTGRLHLRVSLFLSASRAWFAVAVWGFAGVAFTDYLLVIVCGFIFIIVALTPFCRASGGTNGVARGDEAN